MIDLIKIDENLGAVEYTPTVKDYKKELQETIYKLQELGWFSCADFDVIKECTISLRKHLKEMEKRSDDECVSIYDPIPQ